MKSPEHVGIIMDGNRRWSRENDKSKLKGHLEGKKRAEEIVDKATDLGIDTVSLYTFSTANMERRPRKEKKYLFNMFSRTFEELSKSDKIHDNKIRILVSGRWQRFPKYVQEAIEKAIEATKDHEKHKLNFCLVYNGRDEIVDATREISRKIEEGKLEVGDINRETIKENLYHDLPNPDLIIRTGMKNAKRLSGFLLWGSAYAEFKFRETYWPDYSPDLFEGDIREWSRRRRSKHGR